VLKHKLKQVWDKTGQSHAHAYYCDTCEIVYPEDEIRADLCPAIIGVSCNRCLEDMASADEHLANRLGDTYGLEAKFSTGYNSTALPDGYTYRFNLCEGCLVDLFRQFERPPERKAYMGGEEGEHNWHDDPSHVDKEEH